MFGVGVQSSVNSLFGMSWQPGTPGPADRLIGAVLRFNFHGKYASCSPAGFQNITANEHTMGSHDTVNNEGVGLRRAPPAMMRSDEPDTRPDLGSAWAGELRMTLLSVCVKGCQTTADSHLPAACRLLQRSGDEELLL